jgi:hypothetical protein
LQGLQWLVGWLTGLAFSGANVRARLGTETGTQATGTVTLTQANLTAGDKLLLSSRVDSRTAVLTAVTGAANSALGEWSKDTSSTAAATSLALAINTYGPTASWLTATSAVGVVTITSREVGGAGNSVQMGEVDASGGIALSGAVLTGGLDAGTRPSPTLTFSAVGTANDTITIGGKVLTLVASAANENQITIGGTAAASATNTIAVINANSVLRGLVTASSGGSGIVTLRCEEVGRVGALITIAEASTAITASATSFAAGTTTAYLAGPSAWNIGEALT